MRRPGAVRFYAALRATHDARRLSDVQFLPVTHQESFALTHRQARELLLNDFKHLCLLELGTGRWRRLAVARLVGLERILLLVVAAARRERGKQRRPERAHLLASVIVADRVLHDAMKEQRQLVGGTSAV